MDTVSAEVVDMGVLEGHNGWVTSIIAGHSLNEGEDSNLLISGSRDKTLMIWNLYNDNQDGRYGVPLKSLTGHNHFISDLALSNDNQYLISSSWDKTLRLWDLRTGKTSRRFVGHTKEVFTVAFSPDNRQIISSGADRSIKLWNTLADCKFTSETSNHTDWVSSIRYSPTLKAPTKVNFQPYFASVGWDGRLKIWNINFQIRYTFKAHDGNVNAVAISPNGKYLATGGKDKSLNIWDITDLTDPLRSIEISSSINQIAFNPKLQQVAAACDSGVKIWDLMSTSEKPIADLKVESQKAEAPKKEGSSRKTAQCTSLCWNALGQKLFAGFSDGLIRVWHVNTENKQAK